MLLVNSRNREEAEYAPIIALSPYYYSMIVSISFLTHHGNSSYIHARVK